jgi:hypothetical protein
MGPKLVRTIAATALVPSLELTFKSVYNSSEFVELFSWSLSAIFIDWRC